MSKLKLIAFIALVAMAIVMVMASLSVDSGPALAQEGSVGDPGNTNGGDDPGGGSNGGGGDPGGGSNGGGGDPGGGSNGGGGDPGGGSNGGDGNKVTICHKDKKTLTVSKNAVKAHLAHGDTVGACSQDPGNTN